LIPATASSNGSEWEDEAPFYFQLSDESQFTSRDLGSVEKRREINQVVCNHHNTGERDG